MRLSTEQFEKLNVYSNKEMEKLIESIVNESANAALVNVFDDSVILLDHENGDFYTADYTFDKNNLVLEFKNFDKVELFSEESTLADRIEEFLEEDNGSADEIFETYKREVMSKDAALKDLVDYAISRKSFDDKIDYNDLKEAVDACRDDLKSLDTESYKFYKERLYTHPMTKINYFNFNEDVRVSLIETEPKAVITTSLKEKAENLYKDEAFKDSFVEMAKVFKEDVEEGVEMLKTLIEEHPCLFTLDEAERKTLFGKMFIRDKELRESISDLNKGFSIVFESEDLEDLRNEYMFEEDDEDEEDDEEDKKDDERRLVYKDKEDKEEDGEEKEKPAKEVPEDDKEAIRDDLKEISQKATTPKAKRKLDTLINDLEEADRGTDTRVIKEAVEILSL